MAGKNQIEASKLPPLSQRLDNLDAQEAEEAISTDIQQFPLSPSDLSSLRDMSREGLISLIQRMACQCGLVAAMSKEETAQAMRDILAETALRAIAPGLNVKFDIQARLAAIDKWLDRSEGRPVQRQAVDMRVEAHGTVTHDMRIAQADEEAARMMKIVSDRLLRGNIP